MTAAALARLHARCFTTPRPWSEAEFASLLTEPTVVLVRDTAGFLLGRVVAGEGEILTLAVDPGARRQGHGGRLVAGFAATAASRGAERLFLEVASDNTAAIALYRRSGFAEAGLRRGYFRTPEGGRLDALVMARALAPPAGTPAGA